MCVCTYILENMKNYAHGKHFIHTEGWKMKLFIACSRPQPLIQVSTRDCPGAPQEQRCQYTGSYLMALGSAAGCSVGDQVKQRS